MPNFEKVYIVDTNIILEDANQLLTIGENGKNLVVLPETVIDELDVKKVGFAEINFQAREFGRILSEAEVKGTSKVDVTDDITVMCLHLNGVDIDIVSYKDYHLEGVDDSIVNDRKIIKVAQFATDYYGVPETYLLSNDIMCRTRAIALGVKAQGIMKNRETIKHEFIKVLEDLDPSLIEKMSNKNITDYNKDHKIENYCYHFKFTDGNEKLAYIFNGLINFIDENELRKNIVKPLNVGQLFAMHGMTDDRFDICVIEALAGSGKTLLAIAAGMKMVKQGKYDKIIYIRNSVESVDKAEEVGFLPGLEEKFRIYNYPLYDTLEFIAQKELKSKDSGKTQESIDELVAQLVNKYNIETMWNGSIRGRTISNAFVIIDEIQNFSKKSLQTVLSRMDKDSKVVCIGSNRQIDHPYVNKYTNGLSILMKAAKQKNEEVNIFGTELNKVVRGKITEWTERIFERK